MDRLNEKLWGTVEVQNEGPGIPVELMPKIFDRFVSGPDSRGLGLGLYLAKRIAVAHGGELSVDSPPGEGTRFRLHLPCCEMA
jgi:two-component system OmpR family sensor kinase